jgi:Rrf2 family nitric oxide-sensitive transcriptional repressor
VEEPLRLTTFTDYSLRVLMYVAAREDGRATVAEIARGYAISEHHLTKVVHFLGKCGFLSNTRGHGGGLRLAMPAKAINVGQVVRKTEGAIRPAECFDEAPSHCAIARVCRLRGVLDDAAQAFYRVLEQYTLEDLVADRRPLAKILFAAPRARIDE